MSYKLLVLSSLISLQVLSSQARAWGPEGHQISAAIAQKYLSAKTAAACRAMLGGKDLTDVVNWPDEVRSDKAFSFLAPYHYARVPVGDTYEQAPKVPGGDVIDAARGISEFLKTGDPQALTATLPLTQLNKLQALAMSAHVITDIHQPFHISNPEDWGGNKIKVMWVDPKTGEQEESELHAVADGKIVVAQGLTFQEYADKLAGTLTPAQKTAWENNNYVAWADEGIALRTIMYTFPDGTTQNPEGEKVVLISTKYIKNNLPILENRLLRGGVRLAYVLNWIFDPGSVTPPEAAHGAIPRAPFKKR